MRAMLARKPVYTVTLDLSGGAITTAAWKQIVAALSVSACAVEIFNPSGSCLQIAMGAGGSEVAIPYTVLPGGSGILLPIEFRNGARVSAKAIDASTGTLGLVVLNFFG